QAVLEADLEAGVGAVAVAHHEIDRLVGGNRIAERVERRQAVGGLGGGRRSGRQRHGGRRDRRRIRQRAGDLRAGRAGGVYLQRQQGVGRAVQAQGQQAVRVGRHLAAPGDAGERVGGQIDGVGRGPQLE